MAGLVVVVLSLPPQILHSCPGELDVKRYLDKIVAAVNGAPSSEQSVDWLRERFESVKTVPVPAFLALAVYLSQRNMRVVVDKSPFDLNPAEREKAQQFIAKLNPPSDRLAEENLRLADYLYLRTLAEREANALVILSTKPRGSAHRVGRVIEVDFEPDPLEAYRKHIERVPFRISVKLSGLIKYEREEVLIKFWKRMQDVFGEMKEHLFRLFASGIRPKSRSRPRIEHIPGVLDKAQTPQLGPMPQRQPSLLAEAQSLSSDFKAFRESLLTAKQAFVIPAVLDFSSKPFLDLSRDSSVICCVNPSDGAAINLNIEYLAENEQAIDFFEVETLAAHESKELGTEFILELRSLGAVALRLRQTGQVLRLP